MHLTGSGFNVADRKCPPMGGACPKLPTPSAPYSLSSQRGPLPCGLAGTGAGTGTWLEPKQGPMGPSELRPVRLQDTGQPSPLPGSPRFHETPCPVLLKMSHTPIAGRRGMGRGGKEIRVQKKILRGTQTNHSNTYELILICKI